jgi:tetratricopeptide (TPR) repeat protein
MAVDTAVPPLMTDYPAIFRGYIVRNTQDILARVQQAGAVLPPAERKQALHTLSYALKLPEAWPDTRTLLLTMAPKMEQAGFRDEWIPYLAQGIQQSQILDDPEAEAELHFQLGRMYRLRGKFEEARPEFKTSIKGFERLSMSLNQARAMNRLAQVARLERQFEESTRLAENALSLLNEQEAERAYSYLVLGMVALDKRDWLEAVGLFELSLSLWEGEYNQRMMGRCLISLGAALRQMKKYQEAMTAYHRAIALFEEIQDLVYRAIAQMNLGNVHYYIDQPNEALKHHLQAERIFRRAQDRFYLAHVHHNIGMAYRKLQQWKRAEEAYLLSIEQQEKLGNIAWLVDTMDGLGLAYLRQGQLEKAVTTFEEALKRLAKIEGEPGFESLFEMVSSHLREASEKAGYHQA